MFLGGSLHHNWLLPVGAYCSVTSQSKTAVSEKVLRDWRRFMKHLARRFFSVLALITLVLAIPGAAHADVGVGSGGGTPGTSSNFVLVGQNPLFNRGMNAALAIFDHFVYIGNRTDGSSTCGVGDPRGPGTNCPHPHPGVLILDIQDPTNPTVVGEIGPPLEGNVGITSRELRVLPQHKLLLVMNFRCDSVVHAGRA